ncbi:MAG TPA: hypothetical protein VGG84_05425 [Gemmatimonadaceae bacterium]
MTRRTQSPRSLGRRGVAQPNTPPSDRSRTDAERQVLDELRAWRMRALPDSATPLGVDDLARLFSDWVNALALDPAIVADFTTSTIHYYRRKDVIDPPEGRTAAARWSVRHLWQIAGARLAGHLGLVTLAQARDTIRDADTTTLLGFLAARVVDARARAALRDTVAQHQRAPVDQARPLAGRRAQPSAEDVSRSATMIHLPGDVLCVVPASHTAHHSTEGAHALGRALTRALLDARTR